MGQVWLYRLNLPPREKNIFPSSSYKDTWPMPRYRYGSTCISLFISNSLSICYQFLEFTLKTISISRIRYLFRENTINSLLDSRWHY